MARWGLTPKQAQIWGDIQGAVSERATTAEIWDAVKRAADRLDEPLPPGMFQAVNTMRALAAGLRVSSERLMAAERESPLVAAYIGDQIYLRDQSNPLAGSSYHVRFQVPKTVGGETTMETYTFQYDGFIPATVGELMDDLNDYAQQLSGEYGVALGDVQDVEIGRF